METELYLEELLAFIDRLPENFSKAPGQRLVIRQLLLRLMDCGEMPRDRQALRTLLAPIVCATPEQQQEFYTRFNEWAQSKTVTPPEPAPSPLEQEEKAVKQRWRWAAAVAALLLLGIGAGGYAYFFPRIDLPSAPPPPGLPDEESKTAKSEALPVNMIQGSVQAQDDAPFEAEKTAVRLPMSAPVPTNVIQTDLHGKFEVAFPVTSSSNSEIPIKAKLLADVQIKSEPRSIDISPDGRLFAVGADYDTTLWDSQTGRKIKTLKKSRNPAWSLAFSPRGTRLAVGDGDGNLDIWNAITYDKLMRIDMNDLIKAVAFSPNAELLAVATGGQINILSVKTLLKLRQLSTNGNRIWSLAYSPDGRLLAGGMEDGTIILWSVQTGNAILTLKQPGGFATTSVDFSPDGNRLITVVPDATIWEVRSGKELIALSKPHTAIQSAVFSPNGIWVATGNFDGTVSIWDSQTAKELMVLQGYPKIVSCVAFSGDGKRLAAASDDGTAKVWALESPKSESGAQASPDLQKYSLLVTHPDYEPAYLDTVFPRTYVYARLGKPKSLARVFFRQHLPPPRRYSIWISIAIALALICAGIFTYLKFRRLLKERRAMLEKWETHLDLNPAHFHSRSEEDLLFVRSEFAALAVRLRRPTPEPASGLAIDQTVRRTIEHAGLFSPVRRMRKSGRNYLALLQSSGRYDQRARFWKCFLKRMEMNGVWLDSYQFAGDPRSCRAMDDGLVVTRLAEVASVYPNHTLWVMTETERFFDRNTREPAPWVPNLERWQERSVFGLTDGTQEDRIDLDELGFGFSSGSPLGLGRLGETGESAREWGDFNYPRALVEEESLWLHGQQPKGAAGLRAMQSLNRQLRLWLGRDGYRCLLACSIYPGLAWNLTLHLSMRLIPKEMLEETLGRLLRLPWFRYSRMPQWLREFFLAQLTPEDHHEFLTYLQEFLKVKQEPESGSVDSSLEVLSITERLKEDGQSPTRDYVFLSFLLGKTPRRWRLPAPEWLRKVLFPEGAGLLGIRPIYWLVLGLLSGTLAYAGSERYAHYKMAVPENWNLQLLPKAKPISPANDLSLRAIEIADSQLGSEPRGDFIPWVFAQAGSFAGQAASRQRGVARPGAVFMPDSKTDQPGLVEMVTESGVVLLQPFQDKKNSTHISRVYRAMAELQGRFEEVIEAPAILPEKYDRRTDSLRPLLYRQQGQAENDAQKITGPQFTDEYGSPFVVYDNANQAVLLSSGNNAHANVAAVETVRIPEDGMYSITGAFARAGKKQAAMDGASVLIFTGNHVGERLFSAPLPTKNSEEKSGYFSGSGVARFNFSKALKKGEELHFMVLGNPQQAGAANAFTALQFKIDDHHTSIAIPEKFPSFP